MESRSKIFRFFSNFNNLKRNIVFNSLVSGIFVGLLVIIYRHGIEWGTENAIKLYGYLRIHPSLILPWLFVIAAAGLLIAWLVKLEPMATGSGIPQVKGVLLFGLKMKWYTTLPVRFIAGMLSSFFGLSLGREGPSIQIGACGSQAFCRKMCTSKLEEDYLITGGAAAGLSAAFNAPLSGIVFALEEVHRSFSPHVLLAAATASLTADVVSKYFFGLDPILNFAATFQLPKLLYLWLMPLGILSGLVGALLNKTLLRFQTLYSKLPWFIRPCIALLIALPIGLFLPQILGGGQSLIKLSETAQTDLTALLVLFGAKILFTAISFGSGTPGGIFMPILSVGALSGAILGIVATHLGMPAQYIPDFALCAMAGTLAGSVKAPITSILLIAEMTGSLEYLLPVAACTFIALFISDALKITPIYEALLGRLRNNIKNEVTDETIHRVMEIPVELGCVAAGNAIKDILWPKGLLIVGIQRGEKEILPKGDTVILPGDYLIILFSENTDQDMEKHIRAKVEELFHANTH